VKLYDIAIIGAGVIGSSIARELSRYKLDIALLEKEEELAFGVSKSNSGIIHPGTQNPPGSLKGRLCVQGNLLMRKISKELSVDFKEIGELIVAFNEDEKQKLLALKKEAEALGVLRLKIVDSAWLRENEPNLNKEALCALYAPTAGIISPYRLVYDLAENAVKNGVDVHTKTKVLNVTARAGYFEITASKGIFKSKYLINAAGLFADEISGMLGIDDFKIRPRKGEEFILDKKKENLANHLIFPLPSKISKGVLIIKTADGNPMIGPTAEEVEDKEDLSTSEAGFNKVLMSARRLVPSIDEKDVIAYFAGLRPFGGDDFIIRHETKAPGFINVAGIQSPGLTASPAIALMACDILKKAGLGLKRKFIFQSSRKKTIHLFEIPLSKTKGLIKKDHSYGDIVCRCEMVSSKEIRDAIKRGAKTMDGIKFRTRAQAGRCHGSFCSARIMKILAQQTGAALTEITKRGKGSEIIKQDRFPILTSATHQCHAPVHGTGLRERELVIVGGGPAGMASAISAYENGVKDILVLERDQYLGGILNQCIHTGFGINYFKETLTGPEYADRFINKVKDMPGIEVSLRSIAVELTKDKLVTFLKPGKIETVKAKAVIMATGCREKTREMIHIPGTRPAGIFSAGLAQKLINIEGLLPGNEVVVVGSGDIGLIMARRFTLEGAKVKAIVEIQKETRGLLRNMVQCVEDFDIPVYFRHKISWIHGKDRVEKVSIVKVDDDFNEVSGSLFEIECDTVLMSVGLIPENELIEAAGVKIEGSKTSSHGIFVCGNAFKIYDIVDSVTEDSIFTGKFAAEYIKQFSIRQRFYSSSLSRR